MPLSFGTLFHWHAHIYISLVGWYNTSNENPMPMYLCLHPKPPRMRVPHWWHCCTHPLLHCCVLIYLHLCGICSSSAMISLQVELGMSAWYYTAMHHLESCCRCTVITETGSLVKMPAVPCHSCLVILLLMAWPTAAPRWVGRLVPHTATSGPLVGGPLFHPVNHCLYGSTVLVSSKLQMVYFRI